MKFEVMVKFFNHVAERETSHSIAHAFRFKAVLSSRKKGSLHPAQYIDDIAEPREDIVDNLVPVSRRRRKKQTMNATQGMEPIEYTVPNTMGLNASQTVDDPGPGQTYQVIDPGLLSEPSHIHSITAEGVIYRHGLGPDQQNDEISPTTGHLIPESSQARTETSALGALAHGLSSANELALLNVPRYIMRLAQNGLYTPEDSPAPQIHCSPAQDRTPSSQTPPSQNISHKLRSSIIKDWKGWKKMVLKGASIGIDTVLNGNISQVFVILSGSRKNCISLCDIHTKSILKIIKKI